MKVIVDTSFWIAYFFPEKHIDKNDSVKSTIELISYHEIILPFPSLYEFLNSKFSRKNGISKFNEIINSKNCTKIDDTEYKENALNNFFHRAKNSQKDISLVDEVIKEIIDNNHLKIDYLISFDLDLNNYANSKGIKTL